MKFAIPRQDLDKAIQKVLAVVSPKTTLPVLANFLLEADEKAKTVSLTEQGIERCQQILGIENLYDPTHIETLHCVNQALKANVLFNRDVDYMVRTARS